MEREYRIYEQKKATMEKRAATAEIVLAFALVLLNSLAIILLCNWYYKKRKDNLMQQ